MYHSSLDAIHAIRWCCIFCFLTAAGCDPMALKWQEMQVRIDDRASHQPAQGVRVRWTVDDPYRTTTTRPTDDPDVNRAFQPQISTDHAGIAVVRVEMWEIPGWGRMYRLLRPKDCIRSNEFLICLRRPGEDDDILALQPRVGSQMEGRSLRLTVESIGEPHWAD